MYGIWYMEWNGRAIMRAKILRRGYANIKVRLGGWGSSPKGKMCQLSPRTGFRIGPRTGFRIGP